MEIIQNIQYLKGPVNNHFFRKAWIAAGFQDFIQIHSVYIRHNKVITSFFYEIIKNSGKVGVIKPGKEFCFHFKSSFGIFFLLSCCIGGEHFFYCTESV